MLVTDAHVYIVEAKLMQKLKLWRTEKNLQNIRLNKRIFVASVTLSSSDKRVHLLKHPPNDKT